VGTAFEVSPQGDKVSYTVIHSFGAPGDGIQPDGDIVISGDGAIHGITDYNTAYNPPHTIFYGGPGTVFELAQHHGEWKEKLIYATAEDYPVSVTNGPDGSLFACSFRNTLGLAIKLSPTQGSVSPQWAETDLFSFASDLGGCASLTVDPKGGFVGTETYDGVHASGSLFSLTPSSDAGGYTSTLLHRFSDLYEIPRGSLLRQGGLYYGVTGYSSTLGGTVFDTRP
jgi:hypothetical protein